MTIDHYKALFDATYLRWFDLHEKPALVEIVSVERVELTLRGGAKKRSPVATIKQVNGSITSLKPLVLNRTNADTIAELYGNKPSEWAGKRVVLMVAETQLKGKPVNCIRLRKPKETKPVS